MSFFVYTITNLTTGQVYVGKTNEPTRRWRMHRYHGRGRTRLYRSHLYNNMVRYGLENFEFKILLTTSTESDAFQLEKEIIISLKASGTRLLNNTLGGEGRSLTAAEKQILSHRMKELWKNPVYRSRMLRRNCRRGFKHSLQTRLTISEALKRAWKKDPEKSRQRINALHRILKSQEHRDKVSKQQKEIQQRSEVKEKIRVSRVRRNEHLRCKVNAIIDEYVPYQVTYAMLAVKYDMTVTQVKGIVKKKLYVYLINKP